jgi:hypothetical protein
MRKFEGSVEKKGDFIRGTTVFYFPYLVICPPGSQLSPDGISCIVIHSTSPPQEPRSFCSSLKYQLLSFDSKTQAQKVLASAQEQLVMIDELFKFQ